MEEVFEDHGTPPRGKTQQVKELVSPKANREQGLDDYGTPEEEKWAAQRHGHAHADARDSDDEH